jgi:HK97 family phage portal protein|nr:MAG TPA: portal protein [Caudoviricetes sp.]
MGIKFFEWLRGDRGKGSTVEVSCRELFEAAQEYQVRELCFWICVNMVANAIGRCEFRTFRDGVELQDREYYLWNVSPNVNQNSTMFFHKLVAKLYQDNEALVVNTLKREEMDALVVADRWEPPEEWPSRQNEYRDVVVGDYSYQFPLYEPNVLHLRLNHTNMRPILNGLYQSYWRMVSAAMRAYTWGSGQHWKVHVSQLAQGADDFKAKFAEMIEEQIRPFLNSNGAILPEFDGYAYENVGGSADSGGSKDTRDIRALIEDIFDFTARGFLIPAVLVNGKVEGTADANTRFLTNCIDPLCDQLQEEIIRKRYGYAQWKRGSYLRVDSSSIIHFDLFANAANVEKLVGSGGYSINDVRRAAGQAPIPEPWADEHFMTLNISPMGEAARKLGAQKGVTT